MLTISCPECGNKIHLTMYNCNIILKLNINVCALRNVIMDKNLLLICPVKNCKKTSILPKILIKETQNYFKKEIFFENCEFCETESCIGREIEQLQQKVKNANQRLQKLEQNITQKQEATI